MKYRYSKFSPASAIFLIIRRKQIMRNVRYTPMLRSVHILLTHSPASEQLILPDFHPSFKCLLPFRNEKIPVNKRSFTDVGLIPLLCMLVNRLYANNSLVLTLVHYIRPNYYILKKVHTFFLKSILTELGIFARNPLCAMSRVICSIRTTVNCVPKTRNVYSIH